MLQRWAPPTMQERAASPSTALAGLLTRHLGPAPLFPLTGALITVAMGRICSWRN
jgi:hypothetical protein